MFPNPATQFKPGESGNYNGRPKGAKSWSTVVQELLTDEKLAEKIFERDYKSYEGVLSRRDGGTLIAIAMIKKANQGDKNAAEWLRKTGYGDKVTVDAPDGFFGLPQRLEVEIVNPEALPSETETKPDSESSPSTT